MKGNVKWTDMRRDTSVFEQVEMEQGDLLKKSDPKKGDVCGTHIKDERRSATKESMGDKRWTPRSEEGATANGGGRGCDEDVWRI